MGEKQKKILIIEPFGRYIQNKKKTKEIKRNYNIADLIFYSLMGDMTFTYKLKR